MDTLRSPRLLLFILVNALLLSLVSLRYLEVVELPQAGITTAYVVLAWIGHGFFLVLPLLALWLLARAFPRAARFATAGAVLFVVALIMLVITDTVVYQQYRFHIDSVVLGMLRVGGLVAFFSITPRQVATLIGIASALLVLETALWWLTGRTRLAVVRTWAGRGVGMLAVCWVASHLLFAWGSATQDTRVTSLHGVLAWQAPLTMNRTLRRLGFEAEEAPRVKDTGGTLHYPLHQPACTAERRPNVLVILVDSWRTDALRPDVMPNVSAFVKDAQYFEEHHSASSSTRGGVFSLFYGLPPTYWLEVVNEGAEPELMRCLREAGYGFAIHASAPLTNPEFDRTIFGGVPEFDLRTPGDTPTERDAEITRRMVSFLRSDAAAQPFFGFLFYNAAHAYEVPEEQPLLFQPSWDEPDYLRLRSGTDPTPMINLYRNAVYYVDREIAEVLAALRETGRMDDTIVIMTSDHAQEFNDNGLNYWGHNGNFSDAQTRVPLIVHWPGRPAGVISHMTTHYDLSATLVSRLFNVAEPFDSYTEGSDLYSPEPRLPLLMANYKEHALKLDDGYLVVDRYQRLQRLGDDYRPLGDDRISADELQLLLRARARFMEAPQTTANSSRSGAR